MRKINYLPFCKVGSVELERSQSLMQDNIRKMYEPLMKTTGLLLPKNLQGQLSSDWLVTATGVQQLKINKGKAYIKDVNNNISAVILENDTLINTPEVDGNYKVLLRHAYTNYEQGTISIANNSNIVNGNGTEFTKILGINRRIYVAGQIFVIASVESDTQLTISGNYSGADINNEKFKIGGYFAEYPLNEEDNLIYKHDTASIVLTSLDKQVNDIYLADVTITNGWITNVVDKRTEILELYHEYPQINANMLRTRRETLWRATNIVQSADASISGLQAQILATDNHTTEFSTKFALNFYKRQDDKILHLVYHPFYTDTGMDLIQLDKVKFQTRLQIKNQQDNVALFLDVEELTYDISNLAEGYYELQFQLKKVSTAFNLSILLQEIYITGNYQFIIAE